MALSQNQWKQIIKDSEKSKLPQKEYCKQHNLNFNTYKYWRSRLKKTNQAKANKDFVEISMTSIPRSNQNGEITIILTNGIQVKIPSGFNLAAIKELLTVLKASI